MVCRLADVQKLWHAMTMQNGECLNERSGPEKIKLRKQEATIVESEKEVTYESLGKIDKEAFDTYRKYLKVDAKFNAWFL